MKNLKNTISLVVGCIVLLAFVSPSVIAQKKSNRHRKPLVKIVKCSDNDSDCFIRAASACRKATVTMDNSAEKMWKPGVPHPSYAQTSRHEIRGKQNGKCVFYSKIVKADVNYREDFLIFAVKNRSEMRRQVEQELAEERKEYQKTAGRDGVCFFQTKKLAEMLNGWWQKDGGYRFSTKDFEGANCQGSLYNFTLPNQTIKLSELPQAKPPQ